MAKATKKNQTSANGSSSRKGKNGNGGKGKAEVQEPEKKVKDNDSSKTAVEGTKDSPEKKRRGKAPIEGEPLKRVLIFLSDQDITTLKAEVGDRGMSTKIREIIKEYLSKRS